MKAAQHVVALVGVPRQGDAVFAVSVATQELERLGVRADDHALPTFPSPRRRRRHHRAAAAASQHVEAVVCLDGYGQQIGSSWPRPSTSAM